MKVKKQTQKETELKWNSLNPELKTKIKKKLLNIFHEINEKRYLLRLALAFRKWKEKCIFPVKENNNNTKKKTKKIKKKRGVKKTDDSEKKEKIEDENKNNDKDIYVPTSHKIKLTKNLKPKNELQEEKINKNIKEINTENEEENDNNDEEQLTQSKTASDLLNILGKLKQKKALEIKPKNISKNKEEIDEIEIEKDKLILKMLKNFVQTTEFFGEENVVLKHSMKIK